MKHVLSEINQHIKIIDCSDSAFPSFGRRLSGFDWLPIADHASRRPLPAEGTSYVRTVEAWEALPVTSALSRECFNGRPLQVGLCFGVNDRMNAMEWHGDSEVIGAATDLLLILGQLSDVVDGTYEADSAIGLFVESGTLIELYATTLHFAPVNVGPQGFRAVIILPCMTNALLTEPKPAQDPLLFAQNKWMVAHPDSPQAGRGAHVGIVGKNIQIRRPPSGSSPG
jgi:hypothetical protein